MNIPAFPHIDGSDYAQTGMSLREYFAAHAPPMPKSDSMFKMMGDDELLEREADWRFAYADAMLKRAENPN